jgi:nucleotide-binding universal stress UspA family protein
VVREAAALARAFDARVILLTVVQPPVVLTEYAAMMDIAELTAAGEKNAARQLENHARKLRSDFVAVQCVQATGAPVTHIVEQSAEWDVDYIVMGSHGHTAFYDLLVGSTTHGVLKRAKCPVMIVPAEKVPSKSRRRQARAMTV